MLLDKIDVYYLECVLFSLEANTSGGVLGIIE